MIYITGLLVGGFNLLEKYESKWVHPSPIFGVKIKHILEKNWIIYIYVPNIHAVFGTWLHDHLFSDTLRDSLRAIGTWGPTLQHEHSEK